MAGNGGMEEVSHLRGCRLPSACLFKGAEHSSSKNYNPLQMSQNQRATEGTIGY